MSLTINKTNLIVKPVSREFALENLNEIAALRIEVFREFPYLYEGSLDYEKHYLERYFKAKHGTFILAFDQGLINPQSSLAKIVGVATCLPLSEEEDFVKKPFIENNFNVNEYFYFGESVLAKNYRGFGLGHLFFNEREKVALSFENIKYTTFCAVERTENHPFKPQNYQPLHGFWNKRGYFKNENLVSQFSWQDINEKSETAKNMTYWVKSWSKN